MQTIGDLCGNIEHLNVDSSKFGGLLSNLSGGGIDNLGGLLSSFLSGGGKNLKSELTGRILNGLSGLTEKVVAEYVNIDPETGKIIGAIAGNVLFHLGGRDNLLGKIGKVVLDRIISGDWHRKVDPAVSGQDFASIRDECLSNETLYEDPEFPADDGSLFKNKSIPDGIEWKRPHEIVSEPQLIVAGESRFDVIQGELGDCWLLAAVANLTLREELFYRVVPPDQSFTDNYAGVFHFQFWQYGTWVDVVIDDRLPTKDGQLIFLHSRDNNEFWSALLEKAYAKLCGSYEALDGGNTCEALEDFTGGLTEYYVVNEVDRSLENTVLTAFKLGSLIGCSINADEYTREARMSNGLVRGHAYSITGVQVVNHNGNEVAIIRMRNPWGNEAEWNGPWADNSPEWDEIDQDARQDMNVQIDHDGEFWMPFSEFESNFNTLEICNLGPDAMNEIEEMTGVPLNSGGGGWKSVEHHGQWIPGETAGGCPNFESFASNPQYMFTLNGEVDDSCIIAVLQKHRRLQGLEQLSIGFAAFQLDEGENIEGKAETDLIMSHRVCAKPRAFINLREVAGRFNLEKGNYVVLPCTYEADQEAEFMIRIFADSEIHSEQLN